MHCKSVGSKKLPFSTLGRSSEKFENHCNKLITPSIRRNRECRISSNTCRFYSYSLPPTMPYNPTQLPESCMGYHGPSNDLHCITVKIIGVFLHASLPEVEGLSSASFVKNTVTIVASCITYLLKFCIILTQWTLCTSRHVWTSCQASGIAGSLLPLPVWLSRYHYCYGVEPHKRKQPCTEPADPQYTYTIESKNRIYRIGGYEIPE
ncbi:hypothetical protein T10_1875 [Trichinella papuae]|uniref:Uncharacterized protein n=1 Tax=Trichinella papuae TaxID=268474 RepID=A0A0V1MX36_9BILA|nr:hypothetical protein T10_1875 [Trichinella papuae]